MSNLSIIFNKGGNSITMQCNANDPLDNVLNRFCIKSEVNINEVTFYYNGRELPICNKTLFNLGIQNFQNINVVESKKVVGA